MVECPVYRISSSKWRTWRTVAVATEAQAASRVSIRELQTSADRILQQRVTADNALVHIWLTVPPEQVLKYLKFAQVKFVSDTGPMSPVMVMILVSYFFADQVADNMVVKADDSSRTGSYPEPGTDGPHIWLSCC